MDKAALSWPNCATSRGGPPSGPVRLPGRAAFEHFASDPDMESNMIDATIVRAHSSAGAKGGSKIRKRWDEAKEVLPPQAMPS